MNDEALDPHGKLTPQMILAFVFGVIFVSVILYLSIIDIVLNPFSRMVFLVVLSLAAGGVGAILPGFIVAGDPSRLVRAGGALAVVLVVLYFGSEYVPVGGFAPKSDPSLVSNKFIAAADQGKSEEAYSLTSQSFQQGMTYFFFVENLKRISGKLGEPKERVMIDQKRVNSPPGLPEGSYSVALYEVSYTKSPVKIYQTINLVGEKAANDWRVFGVWYSVKDDKGNFMPASF